MKLACSTWMIPGETFDEKMKNAARYGFDGVEIRLFEKDYSPTIIKEIIRAGQGAGVNPCSLIMPGEIYRKPLLDRETLEAKVELSKKAIDAAAELGCPTIVCPEYGYQSPLPLFDHPRRPTPEQHDLLISFLKTVSDYAKEAGARVMIEPINRYETRFFYTLEDGKHVLEEVKAQNLGLLADLFHMNIEEVDIPSALQRYSADIYHVHLGDSNRLTPGQGHTDFPSAFSALKKAGYDGYIALECSTAGDPDVVFPQCVAFLRAAMRRGE